MPVDGTITTLSGITYKWVEEKCASPIPVYPLTLDAKVDVLNRNIEKLIDIFQWEGRYDVIEDSLDPMDESKEYYFRFYPRTVSFYSDQRIGIMINEVGNPIINVNPSEMPYIIDVKPNMYIDKVIIRMYAHPVAPTNIKIIMFG